MNLQFILDNHPYLLEQDPEEKARKFQHIIETVLPLHLKLLERLVGATDGDFAVGSFLTFADFVLANWLDIFEDIYGMER